jgi:hypothetical protein
MLNRPTAEWKIGWSPLKFRPLHREFYLPIILGLLIIGFLVVASGFWPGVMIDDARWQYQQAVDNAYEDWHPVLMAWIWHRLMFLQPGPGPILLLQLLLYWAGIALMAFWARFRGRPRLAVALACVGWLPASLALTGTVTKDCLMAGFLLCAAGTLLWHLEASTRAARAALMAGTLIALFAAAALRLNAIFACLPLAMAVMPQRFTCSWPRFGLTALAASLALLMTTPVLATLVQAERTGVQLSLITFDLGGITERSGSSVFPEMGVSNPVAVNHRCYDPYGWDSYSDWAKTPCPLGFDRIQSLVDNDDLSPRTLWLRAIAAHPLAYAEHRLTHFNLSTWFLVPEGPDFTAWSQSVPNPWGFQVRGNFLLRAVNAVADAAAQTPAGWPIFWIGVALAALLAGISAKVRPEVLAIAASAFAYGMGYLIVGVATGIRYYFWTMTAAALAAVLVIGEMRSGNSPSRRSRWVSAFVVGVPTMLATIWRIAS